MKLRVTGHSFRNSYGPDLMPDSGQCVLKRRSGLGFVSRAAGKQVKVSIFDEPTTATRLKTLER